VIIILYCNLSDSVSIHQVSRCRKFVLSLGFIHILPNTFATITRTFAGTFISAWTNTTAWFHFFNIRIYKHIILF